MQFVGLRVECGSCEVSRSPLLEDYINKKIKKKQTIRKANVAQII